MAEDIAPGVRALSAQFEQVSQFQHASPATRNRLAACSKWVTLGPDTFVAEQGMPADTVRVILLGQVHVTMVNAAGDSIWLYSAGPGTMLDPIALLVPPVMPYSITTLSPVDLIEIERDCLQEAVNAEPRVGYEMMHVLAQRMYLIARMVDRNGIDNGR